MPPGAVWTPAEEDAFLDFLVEIKAEAGDGGSFKASAYQRAAQHIAPLLKRGPPKTADMCRNKWTALRKLYRAVCAIKLVSGWVWSDETGASITEDIASSWDDYVKKHPEAKPFRNKGWRPLDKVSSMMPSSSTGANVFHPTSSSTQTTASSSDSSDDPASPTQDTEPLETQDLDGDDDESDVPQPSSSARRPATSTPPVSKRGRTSQGAAALREISQSLSMFGSAIATTLATPQTATDRKALAIASVVKQERTWLSLQERVSLINLFKTDQDAVDVYTAIIKEDNDEDVRKEWIRIQLELLGVMVFS